MILVTLGTHGQRFYRAVDLAIELAHHDQVLVQHGATPRRLGLPNMTWVDYLSWEAFTECIHRADAVVSHAGVGSAVTAIRSGKKPVLVPRLAHFGEHVDDHQVQLAQRLAQRGLVLAYAPGASIGDLVAEGSGRGATILSDRVRCLGRSGRHRRTGEVGGNVR